MAKILIVGNPRSPLVRERGVVGQSAGHEIFWYFRYKADFPGVTSFYLPANIIKQPRLQHLLEPYYLARTIKQVRPDLVHVHFASLGLLALPLSLVSRLVVTTMGSDISPGVGFRGLYVPFTRLLLNNAKCITVKSAYMKEMVQRIGDFAHKVKQITWGVDLELYRPNSETKALRKKLEIPENSLVFFDPRKMVSLYNHHILLRAFRDYLAANGKAAVLLFIEFFPDPKYLKNLKESVLKWDLEKSVRFLRPQSREEMADLYALADIVISIPQSDGFPQTIYEAWASGRFMVLNDLPQYRQELADGATAKLVDVSDLPRLVDALQWVARHPEARQAARNAGRLRAETVADKNVQTQKMNKIYADLLG